METVDRWVGKLARSLHMIAALWLFVLAFLILFDVLGRDLFAAPIQGTPEIVANSLVSIAFLQLSHAIRMRGMLRADLLTPYMPAGLKRWLAVLGYLIGVLFFLAIAYASWSPMLHAWEIREYQGEGALRVPTYPVRSVIVATSLLAAAAYFFLMLHAWRGEEDAPAAPAR